MPVDPPAVRPLAEVAASAENTTVLEVPHGPAVSYLIGPRGATISALEQASGCRIDVQKTKDMMPGSSVRNVTVTHPDEERRNLCAALVRYKVADFEEAAKNVKSEQAVEAAPPVSGKRQRNDEYPPLVLEPPSPGPSYSGQYVPPALPQCPAVSAQWPNVNSAAPYYDCMGQNGSQPQQYQMMPQNGAAPAQQYGMQAQYGMPQQQAMPPQQYGMPQMSVSNGLGQSSFGTMSMQPAPSMQPPPMYAGGMAAAQMAPQAPAWSPMGLTAPARSPLGPSALGFSLQGCSGAGSGMSGVGSFHGYHGVPTNGVQISSMTSPGTNTVVLEVPNGQAVSYIIGTKGATIHSLQATSGCKVHIQKAEDMQPGTPYRLVTVTSADVSKRNHCIDMICSKLGELRRINPSSLEGFV